MDFQNKGVFLISYYSFKNNFIPDYKREKEIHGISRHYFCILSIFLIKIFPELIEIGNFACEA